MNFKQFLKSKKAKAFIIGLITLISSKLLELEPGTVDNIVKLVSVYILGQGVADHGKGKVEAEVEYRSES